MTVRYDKLWILLIKNKMKKGELAKGGAPVVPSIIMKGMCLHGL